MDGATEDWAMRKGRAGHVMVGGELLFLFSVPITER